MIAAWHDLSVYPKKDMPFVTLFTAGLCSGTAVLAILTHQYPKPATALIQAVSFPNSHSHVFVYKGAAIGELPLYPDLTILVLVGIFLISSFETP